MGSGEEDKYKHKSDGKFNFKASKSLEHLPVKKKNKLPKRLTIELEHHNYIFYHLGLAP